MDAPLCPSTTDDFFWICKGILSCSVADPDIHAFLIPGSGIRNRSSPDPVSQTHIFESFYNSLIIGPNFFLQHFKNKIILILWNTWLQKRHDNKIYSPLSFAAVFGSGKGKSQDLGSGINISDPQHCLLVWLQECLLTDPLWISQYREFNPGGGFQSGKIHYYNN